MTLNHGGICLALDQPAYSRYPVYTRTAVGTPVSSLTPLIGSTLPHSHATQTSYGATDFYIIRHNFSFVQSRPFWFIPLDTAMIAEPKYIYQVFVKQKIKTIRRVEAKERKRNLYTTFLLSLLFVTFIK